MSNSNPLDLRSSPLPAQERRAAETFHVVDFIREEIDERNWPIWTLVRRMSDDQSDEALGRVKLALELLELRDPHMLIGEEIAAGLARAFGTGQEIWLNLDQTWRNAQRSGAVNSGNSSDQVESSVPHQTESNGSDASGYVRGLEDAAKVCDDASASLRQEAVDDAAYVNEAEASNYQAVMAESLATAIRALISQHSPQNQESGK